MQGNESSNFHFYTIDLALYSFIYQIWKKKCSFFPSNKSSPFKRKNQQQILIWNTQWHAHVLAWGVFFILTLPLVNLWRFLWGFRQITRVLICVQIYLKQLPKTRKEKYKNITQKAFLQITWEICFCECCYVCSGVYSLPQSYFCL